MHFRLNPECYFIRGNHSAAIYDLIEGTIYSLDGNESRIVAECEENKEISGSIGFLKDLQDACVGKFYEEKIFMEKLRVGSPIEEYQPGHPPYISKAFLEINNKCTQDCWFCGYNGISRSLGCMGCNKWLEEGDALSLKDWKQVVDQLVDLDCHSILLTGGDLTSCWETTLDIIQYARNSVKNVSVIMNINFLSEKILDDVKNQANLIINTENPGDISRDNFYILTIAENEIDKTNEISSENVSLDLISKDFRTIDSKSPLVSKKKINKTDIYQFSHNKKFHPCLGNSLTISWRGEVLPCPLMRSRSFGKIHKKTLPHFFKPGENNLETFWNLRLDTLSKCKNCEFRYSCGDCRALEESLTGNLSGKVLCNYDPENGVWIQ